MTSPDPSAYDRLLEKCHDLALIHSTTSALHWDQETFMPPKALDYRSRQLAFLSGWAHQEFTSSETGALIADAQQMDFATDTVPGVNVRQLRRAYDQQTKIPSSLVEEMSKTSTLARSAWVEARAKRDFSLFLPHLEKLISLSQKKADYLGSASCRYDSLMDEYEQGESAARLRTLFAEFRKEVAGFVHEAIDLSKSIPGNLLDDHYPIEAQQRFNRDVAAAIGFDFDSGRIDTTTHPFCTELGPRDCRLTTRYDERNFLSSLYGILHEAGHGLYNLGLSEENYGLPAGSFCSLGIHESQSRLWENHIGRTLEFWSIWHEKALHYFPSLKRHSPEQIARFVNRSEPSYIRVEADELTYDLHIILRFEIEYRLIQGDLKAHELPDFWNEEFEKSFGLKVPNDSLGCLQDIHWSMGGFGYFPTYTLGNMNAAQLMRKAHLDHPHLNEELARGNYSSLLGWLRRKIHAPGQKYPPQELMQEATGEKTNPVYHVRHLKQKVELLREL